MLLKLSATSLFDKLCEDANSINTSKYAYGRRKAKGNVWAVWGMCRRPKRDVGQYLHKKML